VNDLASTDVDAVMQIAAPRCDKVRTQRGLLVPDQQPVASELPVRWRMLIPWETNVMLVSSLEKTHRGVTVT